MPEQTELNAASSGVLRQSKCKLGLLLNFNVKWLVIEGIMRRVNGFPE